METARSRTHNRAPKAIFRLEHRIPPVVWPRQCQRRTSAPAQCLDTDRSRQDSDVTSVRSAVSSFTSRQAHAMLEQFGADPAGWLMRSGIAPEPRFVDVATQWPARQPATTVRAMAASVVAQTGTPNYTDALRRVFRRHRVHLIAGARSRAGWEVPDWALQEAASITVLPDCGHMMMLEQPEAFAHAVTQALASPVRGITRESHHKAKESPAT